MEATRKYGKREKQPLTELRNIPGVGKVNESKLIEKGYGSVESLKELFVTHCKKNQEEAVRVLKGEVGIRSKKHCESIAEHVGGLVERPAKRWSTSPVTVCVEGNISAGKSTFLKIVSDNGNGLTQHLQVVQEPVDQWQTAPVFGEQGKRRNLLDEYYANPGKSAYVFQTYVFLTRVLQEAGSRTSKQRFRLMERSVFSDRMVFVKKLRADNLLNDDQVGVYDGMFAPLVEGMPDLVPDGFIYLRAMPKTCMRRMKKRSRSEEVGVPQDYLEGLHDLHEGWLQPPTWLDQRQHMVVNPLGRTPEGRVLVHGCDQGAAPDSRQLRMPDCIRNDIKWVYAAQAPLVSQTLGQVPVLVLNMDEDLDLDHDVAAKRHLSAQVAAYFEFMADYRDNPQVHRASASEVQAVKASMQDSSADASMYMRRDGPYGSLPQAATSTEQLVQRLQQPSLPEVMERLMGGMPKDDLKLLYHLLHDSCDKYQARRDEYGGLLDLSSALERSATKAFFTEPVAGRALL